MNEPAAQDNNQPEAVDNEATVSSPTGNGVNEEQVKEALKQVIDPELHMDVVSLGLIYGVTVAGTNAAVRMSLTSPGCPYGPQLIYAVEQTALALEGIEEVDVEVVWDPPWGPDKMTEEAKLELGFDL